MHEFTKLVKKEFPDYMGKAEEAYVASYAFWDEENYTHSDNFRNLRDRRHDSISNRAEILNLYKEIKPHNQIKDFTKEEENLLYDAFLCTMVWGNIGLRPSKIAYFDSVFNYDKNDLLKKLKRVWVLLSNGDINGAFNSMKNTKEADNYIYGVGSAFFTKFLYFSGDEMFDNNQPLIYDSVMVRTHKAILLAENNYHNVNNDNINDYLEYIQLMNDISIELGLKSADYLEALLFSKNNGCRQFIINYVNSKLKGKPDQNNVIFPKSQLHDFWKSLQDSDDVYKGKTPDTDFYYIKSGKLWMKIIRDGNYNGDKTYQCFSINRKILNDNLLKKLEEEFSAEMLNGDVKADYNDKAKIVYYNCSSNCLNDSKINEKELIRWFNAHAKNLVKIINVNK